MTTTNQATATVDWSRYLPPHPLPDTGRKEFKAGQAWAIHDPHDGECMVLLLVSQDDTEILAGRSASGSEAPSFGYSDGRMRHSILVQDVNEPHPRDPATLWAYVDMTLAGWKPGTPNLPKPELAPPPAPTKPKCPACDEERDLGATGKCWDCYEVGEAYVALVQQDDDARRAEIKRTLMRPATLDPLWQRNVNVGVWRLR